MYKEVDLYEPCKIWLEEKGCDVRGEIHDIDILGIYPPDCTIGVEMKINLNLEVINQAVQRQKLVDYVYVATIHNGKTVSNKRTKLTMDTLRRLNIGWVTVNFKANPPRVQVLLDAQSFDFEMSRKRKTSDKERLIREFNSRSLDLNRGGSTRKKLMTAYREEALKIAYLLSLDETSTVKMLKLKGSHEKKTSSILNSNFYHWFIKVDRGVYRLSETGRKALEEYNDMVAFIKQQIHNQ